MISKAIWIPGNVPSLKNSRMSTSKGNFHSKTVQKYLQAMGVKKYNPSKKTFENYKTRENIFLKYSDIIKKEVIKQNQYPLVFGLHFVRSSWRKFDFINACQIVFDLLQAHGAIEEDDIEHVLPVPLFFNSGFYRVDSKNPGVWIKIAPFHSLYGVFK